MTSEGIAHEGGPDEPREIWVDETPHSLLSLEVVDGEGLRHILLLRTPMMLPAPEKAT